MKLNPGTRLGPYEVVAAIGAGAMGEVYRATDARLGREVAIKVLPSAHSNDPDRLRRFEQEARAAGTLNHPNILAIYDIGSEDGSPYVVSELLEGETLRERLSSDSSLSPRKATEYAIQLAHGLAAAHQKGIVHRDLKPENLFLTTDGRLKILDFGLAKLIQPDPSSESQTNLPTAAGATQPGLLLGTMGYMSPEQVRGKPADARSDIFAFGAILYEMLSGARAFHGDSAVETMNAILKEDPPELSSTNRMIPPGHERIVQRCLEKNPDERFQSARDLAFGLEALSGHSGISVAGPAPAARRQWRRLVPAALVLAGVALVAVGFFAGKQTGSAGAKASFPVFHRLTFRNGGISSARFASDGQSILYSASWDGKPDEIFSTRAGSPESRSLNLRSARLFSVTPSGEIALGLTRPGKAPTLARVSLGGGAPRELMEEVGHADWSPNGSDVAVVRRVGRQHRIEFPIGKVLYETFNYVGEPRVSPKGDRIAFSESFAGVGSVTVMDLAGKRTTLSSGWKGVDAVAWSPSADEIWFSATETGFGYAIYAVNVTGPPSVRLLLRMAGPALLRDVARDGRVLLMHSSVRTAMMCLPPGETKERDLAWFDADVPVTLSDDGRTLLFNEYGEASGTKYPIYLRKTDGSDAVLLGEGPARSLSPDGKWVAIIPTPAAAEIILLPTGAGQSKILKNDVIHFYHGAAWFPDGKRIVVAATEKDRTSRSWVLDVEGGKPRPITPEGVAGLLVTPDGKFLIALDAKQNRALYPVEGGEPRSVPGFEPGDRAIRWSADGRSIFVHQTADQGTRIFLVDITTGRRTLWKELAISEPAGSGGIREVFLTPDGKSYVYWYVRELSDLYLVEGLK